MAKKKAPAWQAPRSAAENAKSVLPVLAKNYFAAGRKVLADGLPADQLHRFRLKTKRFRYTLELFRPCYTAGLDQRLAQLRQIQQFLGDVSDCFTARDMIMASRANRSRRTGAVFGFLDQRAAARVAEFRTYWTSTFDAQGRERNWVDYLTRFAGRGKARPRH
jgi:CHAD domain-containing protein